ncbi:hypothetical protein AWN76_008870 [Rhodothermaceae bacterium RA]|nr:hypothetical protein AWN76_008870 [Rhodothermaceae bacterium RA]
MNKRHVVRLQLVLLGLLVVLLVVRTLSGPPAPDGLVVLADLEPDALARAGFAVEHPVVVRLEGIGSFQGPVEAGRDRPPLAAYGWLLRREDRAVVWRMEPGTAASERGTLARSIDTLGLDPGTYDLFFASYGASFGRSGSSVVQRLVGANWRDDADRWAVAMQPLDDAAGVIVVEEAGAGVPTGSLAPQPEALVWTSAPMAEGPSEASHLFEVDEPVVLDLYACGELPEMDYGWVEDAVSGRRIWTMTMDTTEPAGGAEANRLARVPLRLAPGIYRAVFRTDAGHHYGGWRANPPLDPAAWGMTLSVAQPRQARAVTPFDPWTMRTPLLRITSVPNNTARSATFTLSQPLTVVVYAVGELGRGDDRYDHAWITRAPGSDVVWRMSRAASRPAGGHENNRVEIAFLPLQPGTYTVHYETDGSHAFGNWSNGAPTHPERWGVTLFPLPASVEPGVIQQQPDAAPGEAGPMAGMPTAAPPPPTPPPPDPERLVLQMAPLGNEVRRDERLVVSEPTTYRLYALGELSLSGRYDYGWIERADTGDIVWEMTWENTRPAGGDDRNRFFEGTIRLEPGTYVVHFRTDWSHAYGDFGGEAPAYPEHWGLTIERVTH